MVALRDIIIQKLEDLPEPSLREVLDFIETLAPRDVTQEEDDPFLSVIGTLSCGPISNEEIDEELYGPITVKEN